MGPKDLPASYDAWKTWTPDQDDVEHIKTCPFHEDNHDAEHAVCICPTEKELRDEAAEARADAARED